MATQADIDALLSAMANGERMVRFADGRSVEYRSIAELGEAIGVLRREYTSAPMNRTTTVSFRRG